MVRRDPVYILIALLAVLSVPAMDGLERRSPFAFVMGLLALGLVLRYDVVHLHPGPNAPYTPVVFWLFALGWAAAQASGAWQRILVTAVLAATVPGFFGDPRRDAIVIGGMLVLMWVPSIRCPRPVSQLAGLIANSSLYIYLTHWQIYPLLGDDQPWLALGLSVAFGIAYHRGSTSGLQKLTQAVPKRPQAVRKLTLAVRKLGYSPPADLVHAEGHAGAADVPSWFRAVARRATPAARL